MLSTKVFSSSSNAQKYYSHADYYGAEAKGMWFGKGAEDFRLHGMFEAKTDQKFKDLLGGKMHDGRRLGKMSKDGKIIHRPGADLTFSSPKSFSIQMHVIGNDKEKASLTAARMKALQRTLSYIEDSGMIYTRKGADGVIREPIRKLTYALFAHTTNRKLEPQDHVHCLLINATKCSDDKYRTIVWDNVLKNNKYIGQIFRNELALEVQKAGHEIRTTLLSDGSSSFELRQVSQNLIDAFSTRRKEILELFKRFDVKTKAGKDRIVINSRKSKQTISEKELKNTWAKVLQNVANKEKSQSLKESESNFIGKVKNHSMDKILENGIELIRGVLDKTIYKGAIHKIGASEKVSLAQVSKFALESITYNNSVFTKEQFCKLSLKYGIGEYTIKDVNAGFKELIKTKDIIASEKGENLFTSKELLLKERSILKLGKQGIDKCSAIIKQQDFKKRFALHEKHSNMEFKLNRQQINAVKHILTSKDKVTAIQGLPGVGKSTVLESVKHIAGSKINTLGIAPTASAAKTLEESSGIKGKTLHSFIGKYRGYLEGRGTPQGLAKTKDEFRKSIVFVDEASLVGTRLMHDLLNLSEILKFRVVLIGDTKQLGAVEAGKPFEQLLTNYIKSVKLDQIIRQKNQSHIKAVQDAANSKILESFKVHESNISGSKQFVNQAVKKYLSLSEKEKDNTILISPSKEHRDMINFRIVKHSIEKRILKGPPHQLSILRPVSLNKSDYNYARSYEPGNVVKFNTDYKNIGIKKGDSLKLHESNQISNTLLFKSGIRNVRFQLKPGIDYTSKLEVFKTDVLDIREGLKLRVTKNENKLINSETVKIVSIDSNVNSNRNMNINNISNNKTIKLQLEDNSYCTVSCKQLKYVDYGYCSTVHSAQGKTTDKLIAAVCDHSSLNSQKSWLVSISRHKSDLHVYMQDKEKIREQITHNKGTEKSATDMKPATTERQMSV